MSPASSSTSSDEEDMAAFASVAVDASAIATFASKPAAAQGDDPRSAADANLAGEDEEAMPAVFQDRLWAALDRKLAAAPMAAERPTRERKPTAAVPDDPGDTGIRLFSRVPEGAALQDAVNRRQTVAPPAQRAPKRTQRRQHPKVTLEDLEAMAVDPQQLLDFAARAAEQARADLGPPLQTLFEPDGRQHGARPPASLLQQTGVPACLRADLDADATLRQQCTFWRPAHRRQQALDKEAAARRQEQLLLRRQAQAAARRVAGKRPKGKAGKGMSDGRQKPAAGSRQSREAAIFDYLLGKG